MNNDKKPLWRRTGVRVAAVVIAIPVLALAWYLGSPLFLDKTVVEAFPEVTAAPAGATAAAPDEAAAAGADQPPAVVADDGNGADTAEDADDVPSAGEAPGSTATETAAGDTGAHETATEPATGPVVLFSGEFQDADDRHRGSGTATIYELEDGSRVLRFEDLDVTNGPALHVILSPTGSVETRDDVMTPGYVDLGELKGNKGDQNYEIPADVDLSGDVTIVIYCVPFHVVFSTASLVSA